MKNFFITHFHRQSVAVVAEVAAKWDFFIINVSEIFFSFTEHCKVGAYLVCVLVFFWKRTRKRSNV
jgi:hypothetical protein